MARAQVHGGSLIPYKNMPRLEDMVIGEGSEPSIIISTKNLNRGIGGQVRERRISFRSCKNTEMAYITYAAVSSPRATS